MSQVRGSPVVIDNGSDKCFAGISGYEEPMSCFSCIVGKANRRNVMFGMNSQEFYVGQQAQAKRRVLNLSYPLKYGIINNWDDMVKIWDYQFYNELNINPSEHPVLLTEGNGFPYLSPKNYTKNREKITEIMFENYEIPEYYLSQQAVLSLYSTIRMTGVVVDIGSDMTHIVPIYEGHSLRHAIQSIKLGGRDLTDFLRKLLKLDNLESISTAQSKIIRDIKQRLCYVSFDFEAEMASSSNKTFKSKTYELPDGQIIEPTNPRFICPEALFKPTLINKLIPGVHEAISQSLSKCAFDFHRQFSSNILLSGGTALFEGLPQRLEKEITALTPSKTSIKVIAPKLRFSSWIGGSILSSLSSFKDMSISKHQYLEEGSSIVHRKCF